jgi:hypothetical protein
METKRGRPRKYDYKQLEAITEGVGSRAKTTRGRQNIELANRAFEIIHFTLELGDVPDERRVAFRNLLDNLRPSVFAELGRFVGEDSEEEMMRFWDGVHFLMDNPEMPAKKAIRLLRRHRLGGGGEASIIFALHNALLRVVNEHLERYPDLDRESVETALELTLEACETLQYSEAASE